MRRTSLALATAAVVSLGCRPSGPGTPSTGTSTTGTTTSGTTTGQDTATTGPGEVIVDLPPPLDMACQKIDFLFVIDNSGSMEDEQERLIDGFPGFIAGIEASIAQYDYHLMVVTVDQTPPPLPPEPEPPGTTGDSGDSGDSGGSSESGSTGDMGTTGGSGGTGGMGTSGGTGGSGSTSGGMGPTGGSGSTSGGMGTTGGTSGGMGTTGGSGSTSGGMGSSGSDSSGSSSDEGGDDTGGPMIDVCAMEFGAGRVAASDGSLCPLPSGQRFANVETADLAGLFECAADVGTQGSGAERPIWSMAQAITEQNLPGRCNEGFLRDDAILVVTLITDEEDDETIDSPGNPAVWKDVVVSAKNGDESAVVMLGLLGDTDLDDGTCQPFNQMGEGAEGAPRLREFVESFTRGSWASVCLDDFAPFFNAAVVDVGEACEDFTPPG